MTTLLTIIFILICVLLIIVVLLQKGRGVGVGIIGGGGGQSAFGTRTGDVFTWVTIILVIIFLGLAVGASKFCRPAPGRVSNPVFIPPPQPISKPILVTIRCPTTNAEIFYTTDNSEPTRESLRYEGPVRVIPGTTLKARAYYIGWIPSSIVRGEYRLAGTATSTTTAPAGIDTSPKASKSAGGK